MTSWRREVSFNEGIGTSRMRSTGIQTLCNNLLLSAPHTHVLQSVCPHPFCSHHPREGVILSKPSKGQDEKAGFWAVDYGSATVGMWGQAVLLVLPLSFVQRTPGPAAGKPTLSVSQVSRSKECTKDEKSNKFPSPSKSETRWQSLGFTVGGFSWRSLHKPKHH